MKYAFLLLATAACCFLSCKKDKKSIYEACCGAEPLNEHFTMILHYTVNGTTVDSTVNGYVFIPNVFIVDTSAIATSASYFTVFAGISSTKIISAVYTDADGNELFKAENFLPNDLDHSFRGTLPDGSIYKGLFHYKVDILFVDGQVRTYTGDACAVPCQADGFPSEHLPQCAFPDQNNGYGSWDPTRPGDTRCF